MKYIYLVIYFFLKTFHLYPATKFFSSRIPRKFNLPHSFLNLRFFHLIFFFTSTLFCFGKTASENGPGMQNKQVNGVCGNLNFFYSVICIGKVDYMHDCCVAMWHRSAACKMYCGQSFCLFCVVIQYEVCVQCINHKIFHVAIFHQSVSFMNKFNIN